MTEQEKQQLVADVISQLKSDGTDIAQARVVTDSNSISHVVAYDNKGDIVRAIPSAINNVKIGTSGDLNAYTEAGVYAINTKSASNLPIDNQGAISACLTVLVTDNDGNKVVTQVLNLNNNAGGEGNVYIRSQQKSEWKPWGKLQTNVEVGVISDAQLDDLRDNGMYSGVLSSTYETFVLVVINNYAIATQVGYGGYISQLKYSVNLQGEVMVHTRMSDAYGNWSGWIGLDEKSLVEAESNRAKGEEQKLNTAIAEEAARAKNRENDLAAAINTGLNDLGTEFTEADNTIKGNAMQYNTLGVNTYADKAEIYGRSIDGNPKTVDIPAATPTKAGVMSAADKVALDNVDKKINQAVADIVDSAPESFDTLKEVATWIQDDKTGAAAMAQAISNNTKTINEEKERSLTADAELINAINKEAERVDNEMAQAKTMLVNGDVIVGQSREVYSRTGKPDSATFLKRTTAGGTSIGGGVATLKQIGGNIVKNLVEGRLLEGSYTAALSTITVSDGVAMLVSDGRATYGGYEARVQQGVVGHIYYAAAQYYRIDGSHIELSYQKGYDPLARPWEKGTWLNVSLRDAYVEGRPFGLSLRVYSTAVGVSATMFFTRPLLIDLTEMFGAGNEPTKEECDKMFGTMDALPQGLTIAKPTSFKSVGYNQANPANILVGKGIENGTIIDKADSNIAVIECLPCKIGVGENNGYCIHGDFAEGEEKVYLSPLNPMNTEGELYMHQLTRNDDKGTYVPQIKGYMLVEVPDVTNLCVHFLWSEDWDRHDYEPYHESVVALPDIPEMSEWGLAGLCSSVGAKAVYDTIDLENSRYTRRIGSLKIKELSLETGIATANGVSYRYFFTPNKMMQTNAKCLLEGYVKVKQEALAVKELENMTFMAYDTGRIYLRNDNCSTINDFLASEGEKRVFYELITPEEYPIVVTDKNYISSDYGTEEFDAKIPLNANNLYYQRSLVGETRNFLDRLMAGLGTDDVTAIADRIITAISPAVVNNDIIEE